MSRRFASACLPLLVLLLVAHAPARADRLVPRSGRPIQGVLVRETAEEVVFNPFWSRNPGMVWEVVRLPPARVKRVEVAPHPEVEFWRRANAAAADADALAAAGAYAAEEKLKAHARYAWARALRVDAAHEAALAGIGGATKWAALRKGDPVLDEEVASALEAYEAEADPAARREQAKAIAKLGFDVRPEALERRRRSALEPRGLQEDRPLAWEADLLPGAVYTLYVPTKYVPTRTWPLLVGLHGGGADGKAGDEVVGSGSSAMNFYRDLAEQRGYVVACPNALQAPWGTRENEALVRAVIREVTLLYHVDVDRIHLTGHSMGGFGTWALGPRLAEDLATISPMAGGGGSGAIDRLVKTRTPVFVYHSDDDRVVGVESDRQAAKQLQGTDLDFVYTELPGEGHGFPESVRVELFEFLDTRRRHDPKHKDVGPRSSFEGKVTKEEEKYLGDPLAELEGREPTLDDLAAALEIGGGRAARAVDRLGATRPEGAGEAVEKVLRNKRLAAEARSWAARALGLLEHAPGARELRQAVVAEAERSNARLVVEAAGALARIADPEAGDALSRAVQQWGGWLADKVQGEAMAFGDLARGLPVLTALVRAWGGLPGRGDAGVLDRAVVKPILLGTFQVATSERVPQDPTQLRAALVGAVARAYAAWGADEDLRARLAEAAARDPASQRAYDQAGR